MSPRRARASSSDFMPHETASELVVAEVGARGPAGDDEAVVADGQRFAELVDVDLAGLDVDVLHLPEDRAQVRVVPQDVADGRRDLALREDPGRHLVQQGLEEMVVGPVDEGDPHLGPLEGAGGEEPAEATPDDDDVVQPGVDVGPGPCHRSRSTTIWT